MCVLSPDDWQTIRACCIGVGVVWLLGNLGVLTTSSLVVLVRLWPLLLILIGLDLLFGRWSSAVGELRVR